MKKVVKLNKNSISVISGLFCFCICVFMLYFRPQESWYDDAFWADWAYRLSQGCFITHVWGGDQPSYSPLYALLLAGWYKIVGFSYFNAQMPNLLFALATYCVICFRIDYGKLIQSKLYAICFAVCYWFADGLYWIFSCGRVDTLCLLLGVLTIDSFVRAYENGNVRDIILMCFWSFLEMSTGFEGVMFTAIVMAVYSLHNVRLSLKKWHIYVWYIFSSCASFFAVLAWMAYHNCAKAFLRTMFNFSYTLKSLLHFAETGDLTFENIVPLNDTMTIRERMGNLTISGIVYNKEYIFFMVVIVVLLVITIFKKKYDVFNVTEKTFIKSSILMPWVFMLAGRYATYYTWVAYVPCCIALFVLLKRFNCGKIIAPIVAVSILVWFYFSPDHQNLKRIDFHREIDAMNLKDIEAAKIVNTESTYIPYAWYYYLAPANDKLYFKGSGRYRKDMKKMILDDSETKYWNETLELEYLFSIGDRKVYKVIGDYGKNILKDE